MVHEVTTGLYRVDNFGIMNYELQREVVQCRDFAERDFKVFCMYKNRSTTLDSVLKEERRRHLIHRRGWSHSVYVVARIAHLQTKTTPSSRCQTPPLPLWYSKKNDVCDFTVQFDPTHAVSSNAVAK